ncbi:MAG: DNA primase [Nocardioides sp.]
MAVNRGLGRIREEDIAEVREKARIDDVVSSYVTLRKAGGGSFKGLCPFHEEKSPSFHVTPARNFWHCFGCGEGGDVIAFVMKSDGLGFAETVERLAEKYGVQLRREDGDSQPQRPKGPRRSQLIEAHKVAQEFYAAALANPEALAARQFLHERGFDQEACARFGVGFAPRGNDALVSHLRARGFSDEVTVAGGLVVEGRGHYDRFRGRLMWPIRDAGGETIGFGARRLFADDRIDAKYLNTPETPIYKKSQVLYGIDLARRDIARTSQAVVVEGYTDVMACHLAGVPTAVATCGTAFGDDHARILRRFLHDHEEFRGEVIFTFDGDAAGQKAALRAFSGDQNFVSQTYVAVEPGGLDPCDLRLRQGDGAVRELVARRVPLYRFVLDNVISQFDLDRADGRVAAAKEAAKLASSIRDRSTVDALAKEITKLVGAPDTGDKMVGVDADIQWVLSEVRRAAGYARADSRGQPDTRGRIGPATERRGAGSGGIRPLPNLRDPRFSIERETLKLVIQFPGSVGGGIKDIGVNDFTHPTYRAVWEVVVALGGPARGVGDASWAARLRDAAPDQAAAAAVSALGVEGLLTVREPDASYVASHVYRLQELTAMRRIAEVKSRLQRTNPVAHAADYNRMFGELVALEQHRRTLRELAMGR